MDAQSNFHPNPDIYNKILTNQKMIEKNVMNITKSENQKINKVIVIKLFPDRFETSLVETSIVHENNIEKKTVSTADLDVHYYANPRMEYKKFQRLHWFR